VSLVVKFAIYDALGCGASLAGHGKPGGLGGEPLPIGQWDRRCRRLSRRLTRANRRSCIAQRSLRVEAAISSVPSTDGGAVVLLDLPKYRF
jgi:hypothetical protein